MKHLIVLLSLLLSLNTNMAVNEHGNISDHINTKNDKFVSNYLRDLTTTQPTTQTMTGTSETTSIGDLTNKSLDTKAAFVDYTDYNKFKTDCESAIAPQNPNLCTLRKYPGYWCCYVNDLKASSKNLCGTFIDSDAKTKVSTQSNDYSYTCNSYYLISLIINSLLIIAITIA